MHGLAMFDAIQRSSVLPQHAYKKVSTDKFLLAVFVVVIEATAPCANTGPHHADRQVPWCHAHIYRVILCHLGFKIFYDQDSKLFMQF